jgi:hypothetical protein
MCSPRLSLEEERFKKTVLIIRYEWYVIMQDSILSVHVLKVYRKGRIYSSTHSYLRHYIHGEWSASHTGSLTFRKNAPEMQWIGGWADLEAGLRFWRREKSLVPIEIQSPTFAFTSLFSTMTKLFHLNILLKNCICFCPVLVVGTKIYRVVRQAILSPDRVLYFQPTSEFWPPRCCFSAGKTTKHLEDCRFKTDNNVRTAANRRFIVHDTSWFGQRTVKSILRIFKIERNNKDGIVHTSRTSTVFGRFIIQFKVPLNLLTERTDHFENNYLFTRF